MRLINALIKNALSYKYFGERCPITMHFVSGKGRILLITGDNASGKSFVGRFFSEILKKKHKIRMARICMERRGMGGFERACVYGDETWQSTGQISFHAVLGAMKSCNGWDDKHALYFDEPDIGLSEANQAGLGSLIAEKEWPTKTKLVCVTTHSRYLVQALAVVNPHWLRLGDQKSMESFLKPPRPKTAKQLTAMPDVAIKRFRRITRMINEVRRKRSV